MFEAEPTVLLSDLVKIVSFVGPGHSIPIVLTEGPDCDTVTSEVDISSCLKYDEKD